MPKSDAKTIAQAKLDPRGRKVKILATVGPASRDREMLTKLFRAGADAFRVNMSHGEHADHAATIKSHSRTGERNSTDRLQSWPICKVRSCV